MWYARLFAIGLIIMLASSSLVQGQSDPILLVVSVPEFSDFNQQLFQDFEADHPGVQVILQKNSPAEMLRLASTDEVNSYLDAVATYASSADVLLATPGTLTVLTSRAGYWLDMAPLAQVDAELNTSDFIPAAWQSYQWDGGLWALPMTAGAMVMNYDSAAFDRLGVPYPSPDWQMADVANAARLLTERDSSGAVIRPGLLIYGSEYLLRSLIGRGAYDSTQFPNVPQLAIPELEALLPEWAALIAEGAIGISTVSGMGTAPAPMMVTNTAYLSLPGVALLPGHTAGMEVYGLAVSSGTTQPELAYELVKYLTLKPGAALWGGQPARYSLTTDPAHQEAFARALPFAEMRFLDEVHLHVAVQHMQASGDARVALQETEIVAQNLLQAATERRSTPLRVQSAAIPPMQPGEIILNFGIASYISPLPNRVQWEDLAQAFAASDPEVGYINLQVEFNQTINDMAQVYDCFFTPGNQVPALDPAHFLSLDPFFDADANFDRAGLVAHVLPQMQRENATWGYPLVLLPHTLQYNPERLAQAGLLFPSEQWSLDDFINTLTQMEGAAFTPGASDLHALLKLIAAYGGLPLDFRTTPPTVNFTDPATLQAIQQVLDLAKQGMIGYAPIHAMASTPPDTAITTTTFSPFLPVERNGYELASYPFGSQYQTASFTISTGYISRSTPQPAACYRWLDALSRSTDLFPAMPVHRTMLAQTAASQGENTTRFYEQFDALLQAPQTIVFPGQSGWQITHQHSALFYWLQHAFDQYVLENADLMTVLSAAQQQATQFLQCTDTVANCALAVDPEIAPFLPPQ